MSSSTSNFETFPNEASPRPSYRRYVRWAAATVAVVFFAVATLNVLVDPFRVHPNLRVTALDRYRSDARPRVHNSLVARKGDYNLAFVGSSRAQRAFDPESPAVSRYRAVNLANPATSLAELVDVVATIRAAAPDASIVLGLDYHAFHRARTLPQTYRVSFFSPTVHPAEFWLDKWISQNTTRRSIKIFRRWRRDRRPAEWTPTPAEKVILDFAHGSLLWGNFHRAADDLKLVRRLLPTDSATTGAIHLVILPMHASLLETLDHRGLWESFEAWNRELTEVAEGAATLWDFATYSAPARLSLPRSPKDPAPEYRLWFRDPSHITATFGTRLLEAILDAEPNAAEWGSRLTPSSLERHLNTVRTDRELYRSTNTEELRRLQTWWSLPPKGDR
ncbi:MAG: hypothetical protein AAF488_17925 [Planctomycetota bacterium]